ncbi:NADP-dependent malic enzyme [Varunaivibrio sulfuroxidans]|uniref:Allosteric NADP-dependent malic enzyme n=1 Tax=Varunaivibrio sulfuroxidans TaxID=1773489 RepID=A0A4R3JG81_9PROT|nr:NADP-dependent malic enzyme [Varunaivibrio sulfuroxidans]TCS64924.1 allosteric NADP-dependent malic enzyme [Varunaivibrio sulfuroxidans]WES29782.1 NADP-dependent malic enzyme [Varunaivibrio sulfuroxidans]
MKDESAHVSDREALLMHSSGRPGKIEIRATKPLTTQRDLSLAYSPGVAAPCMEIQRDPTLAYDYTAKGNLVAIISNGTAVLGLGDLGALAAKPVMEGKAVLFKRFADIDGLDLEVDTRDVDEFVNCVRYLGPSFGGINLEDIRAPECFIIEQRLRELMDIPIFHDDQHGTAIITAAALINACDLTGRKLENVKVVVNGAGAAAIACVELIKAMGVHHDNVIMCDTKGAIHLDRTEGLNQWKSAHAVKTDTRTLKEALVGADVFLGLSVKGAVTQEMITEMADKPLIFAMANPDPEIDPDEVTAVRPDAIMATGRSDYPNQINNVLGFPYIFRGALDVRATTINDDMKIAAARAIARLAREDVPDEVDAAYAGQHLRYGPEYIIPAPFDPRLITAVPPAVAQAAMDSGVAQKPIIDMEAYKVELSARLDPTADTLQAIFDEIRANPRRIVFAEGEEEKSIRAAVAFHNAGYGQPILIGRVDRIKAKMKELGLPDIEGLEIHNARLSDNNQVYTDFLYARLQRQGALLRDCQRMVNQDRNVFGACMVAMGNADAMVTGLTRNYHVALDEITRVLDPKPDQCILGLTMMVARERTVFLADTAVNFTPDGKELADIAVQAAAQVRRLGQEPRVAMVSFSNFGNPMPERTQVVRDAVALLDEMDVNFEYDGEMNVDVALDYKLMMNAYPFARLSAAANVLIMPGLNAASVASALMQQLGGGTVIGPLLQGLSKPAQIVHMGATVADIVTMGALAVHDAVTSSYTGP